MTLHVPIEQTLFRLVTKFPFFWLSCNVDVIMMSLLATIYFKILKLQRN